MSYHAPGTQGTAAGRPRSEPRARQAGQATDPGRAGLTFRDLVGMLRRHLVMILILFFLIGGAGTAFTVYMYQNHPTYMAEAYLEVDPGQGSIEAAGIAETSRTIQVSLVQQFIVAQVRLAQELGVLERALDPSKYELITGVEGLSRNAEDRERTTLTDDAIRERYERIKANAQRMLKAEGLSGQATELRDRIQISNPLRTMLIAIRLEGRDRQLITDIVNSVADSYMLAYKEDRRGRENRRRQNLTNQLQDVSARLDRAANELKQFKGTDVSLGPRTDIMRRLELLEQARTQAELDVVAANLLKLTLEGMTGETPALTPDMMLELERDGTLLNLKAAKAALERDRKQWAEKVGEGHDEYKGLSSRLATVEEQIEVREAELKKTLIAKQKEYADSTIKAQEKRLADVSGMYELAKQKALEESNKSFEYQQKLGAYQMIEEEMQRVQNALTNARVAAGVSANNVSIRQVARPPEASDRHWPRLRIYIPGSFLLGLIVSLGLAFLVEIIDNRVRTPLQVIRTVRLPVLGTVPDRREDPGTQAVENLPLVAFNAPQSLTAESFRQLRTALMYSTDTELKTLLITSSRAGVGKTVVASNLAITLAHGGSRVLLMDTNFRRPLLHRVFDLPNTVGLSSVLARLSSFDEAVQSSTVANLDVLCCGPLPPSPADLLGSEAMQNLLAEARGRYDSVILDGAPILIVSDAHVLCSMVDGAAMVISCSETSRGVAIRGKRTLLDLKARVVGAVLNRVRATKGGYFREAYKSYYAYAAPNGGNSGEENNKKA